MHPIISTTQWLRRLTLNPSTIRARTTDRARGLRPDEGVSLIEVLVAFTILLITILPLGYLLTSSVSAASSARQRGAALQLADSWIEILSNNPPPVRADGALDTNDPTDPVNLVSASTTQIPSTTLAGTAFTVSANYGFQSVTGQGDSDLCTNGNAPSPSHPAVLKLQVKVTWNNGNSSLTDSTALPYPPAQLQTDGFLAVQLAAINPANDYYGNTAAARQLATPIVVQQVSGDPTVSLSPNPITLKPDQFGCAYIQAPTGTYQISLGLPKAGTPATFTGWGGSPPFVYPSGTNETVTAKVTMTIETQVNLDPYDEGMKATVNYATPSAVDGGVQCPGTAGLTCLSTGNGTSSASATWGGAGTTWSSAAVPTATNLTAVGCTTATTPTCVAVGYGSGGSAAILTTTSNLGTTTTYTGTALTPAVADISQVACPTANGCYAIGTTSTGTPVLLGGSVGLAPTHPDLWKVLVPTSTTFTALNSIACLPSTTTCELSGTGTVSSTATKVFRLDGDPATLATTPTWTPTVHSDTFSASTKITSVGTITCPTSTVCLANGVGDSALATNPTILTMSLASPASVWASESSFQSPTASGSITGLSCTTTTCVAIGTTSTGTAAVWTGSIGAAPHTWAPGTGLPSTLAALTSVACGQPSGTDVADCAVTATTTSSPTGQLLLGSLSSSGWLWNFAAVPAASTVQYYLGVSCEGSPSASRAVCAAVAATPTGPIVVTSAAGPKGTWTAVTPTSLAGSIVNNIPLETGSTGNWTTQVAQTSPASANTTQLTNALYPQQTSIVAGDCGAEGDSSPAGSLNAAPGFTATGTVPLALAPLQIVTSAGVPVSGATVTLSTPSCANGVTTDTYTLPVTDAFGFTRTSIPYGTYTYSVVSGASTFTPAYTLTVGANSITLSGKPPYYSPSFVKVPTS